jgi:PPIC-type PPIASE domain
MKNSILIVILLFLTFNGFSQLDFETNNRKSYNDSTALVEISSIHSKLILGANFEDLALEYSQDPGSFMRGAVLGYTNMKNYDPAFVKNSENLEIGTFSKPFKTDFGYHISQILFRKNDKVIIQHILIRVSD